MQVRKTATQSKTSPLMINVFDGTRQPFPVSTDILYRVIDGNQKQVYAQDQQKPSLYFKGLPFFDNFGDNYTVIVSSDGHRQAGFTPIKLSPTISSKVDIMLIPMTDNLTSPLLAGTGSKQICLFSPTESTTRLDGLATKISWRKSRQA